MSRQRLSVQRWIRQHAFLLFAALIASWLLRTTLPLIVVSALSFTWFVIQHPIVLIQEVPHPFFSISANWVTVTRLVAICVVGLIYPTMTPIVLGGVGLIILLSDKLDGYLAERSQTASFVGAQIDQETDAFYISLFALILYLEGYVGLWVLVFGLLRYLNIIALVLLKQQHKKEPRFLGARLVATMVMVALLVPYVTPEWLYLPYVALSVICLTLSFAYTFSYQLLQPE